MTLKQLFCPASMMWEYEYRKKLNESHIEMTDDEIADEYDKWVVENVDLINKSVEDNIDIINETFKRGSQRYNRINEGISDIFGDDFFDDDSEGGILPDEEGGEDEEGPIDVSDGDKGKEGEENEDEEGEGILKRIRLYDRDGENNVFKVINIFYEFVENNKTFKMSFANIMRRLDVSSVTNGTALWAFTNLPNINLKSWNTGKFKTMEGMFYKSTFNNDSICGWDVTSCTDFRNMFLYCPFNKSLKLWTPGFITVKVKSGSGTEERSVRADLPIIGSTEDEIANREKIKHTGFFSKVMDEEGDANESKNNKKYNKMRHVIDFDEFIEEGRFRDFIDKGVGKVKNIFNTISMKIGSLVPFFNGEGKLLQATSAYTSLNVAASGKIPGVTAFCDVDNDYLDDNVKKTASVVESPEYYGIIKKDSLEYRNYETFASMLNEHYEKYGNIGCFQMINEEETFKRVGFSASDGGVVARDIDSKKLNRILTDLIEDVPANKGEDYGGAVLIWGAPGIGKSTIPKQVCKAWNEMKGDELHKKALMVVQCGDLTIDGFSLPIPVDKSIDEYLNERPALKKKVSTIGLSGDELEKVKKNMHKVSIEAPKTWLPAFKMDATQEELDVLNEIANGYVDIKNEDGRVIRKESTEGGILLFDEFFRAEENIFKVLMQLLLNRQWSGYMLGNKWGLLCCTNRPNDDEEVRKGFEKTGAVVGTRMLAGAYNFIPSFDEWKKWAVEEGHFDQVTLEFLMDDVDQNGEYRNWHTIRPDEYVSKGKTAWPTPRTWSGLMVRIKNYVENHGLSGVCDIPSDDLLDMAVGIIGEDVGGKYVSWVKQHAQYMKINPKELLEDPNYVIPDDAEAFEAAKQIMSYVRTKYSSTDLPDVSMMMNVFNAFNNRFPKSKDNYVKMMHMDFFKLFKIASPDKSNARALKEYVQAVANRYEISSADLK